MASPSPRLDKRNKTDSTSNPSGREGLVPTWGMGSGQCRQHVANNGETQNTPSTKQPSLTTKSISSLSVKLEALNTSRARSFLKKLKTKMVGLHKKNIMQRQSGIYFFIILCYMIFHHYERILKFL